MTRTKCQYGLWQMSWESALGAAKVQRGSAPTGGIWLNLTGDLPLFRRNGKQAGVRLSVSAEGKRLGFKNDTPHGHFLVASYG